MHAVKFVFLLSILLIAMPLGASDGVVEAQEKAKATQVETPKPDYSKHAMMIFVWEIVDENEDRLEPWVFGVPKVGARVGFQLAAPIGVETASFSAWPDPFAIAPISAAYTPRTFRDRWGTYWTEKRLGIKD